MEYFSNDFQKKIISEEKLKTLYSVNSNIIYVCSKMSKINRALREIMGNLEAYKNYHLMRQSIEKPKSCS